jgi:Protein of unknown function (DUF3224)
MLPFSWKERFLNQKHPVRFLLQVLLGVCLAFGTCAFSRAGSQLQTTSQEKSQMSQHASGPFDVKLTAQKPDSEVAQAANLGRMTIDKQFHGDLEAVSKGEMLFEKTAGYVALERVTGSLKGRRGSFVLQHSATVKRGVPDLLIFVVPDSGTGELQGLTGKMNIIIAPDGKHSYTFDYAFE